MPAPAIPSNILTADLVCDVGSRFIRSRTYWQPETPPGSETDVRSMADAIMAVFKVPYTAVMPVDFYFSRVECRFYGAGNTLLFANSSDAAAQGTVDSVTKPTDFDLDSSQDEDVMPLDNALIIQKKTGLRGRSNQGRLFIGGMPERMWWRGEINAKFVTKAKTLAAKVNTDITVTNGSFSSILHARHWNRKENLMKPITNVYVVKLIGSRADRRPNELYERV